MKLLLNGCSFMDNYYYAQQFAQLLDADVVSLAKPGSSNRRIIRTTVDYIEQNSIDAVVIGLTFYDRQESPLAIKGDPWVSYNNQGIQAVFSNIANYSSPTEYKLLDKYVLDRYRYDINEHYLDQLYLDLRMFCSYLKQKNIKFCIFNMCDRHHRPIELAKGIVPFEFIGNEFLQQQGVRHMEQDKDLPTNARHHYGEDVIVLTKFLVNELNA